MKTTAASLASCALAAALTCHADPVTGWVTTNGDAGYSGGSEATNSPITTDADGDAIAAGFADITLDEGDSIVWTGTWNITGGTGTIPGNQMRFGLFKAPSPPATGVGSGYIGVWGSAPSGGILVTANGSTTNPFSGAATKEIAKANASGGNPQYGTTYDLTMTVTRVSATEIEVGGSFTDNAGHTTTWPATVTPASPSDLTYNAVAILMGGTVNATTGTFAAMDVTYLQGDSDNDGMRDSWELINGLEIGTDDSAGNPDNDGLTNIQEYEGADGTPFTGDETDPQDPDTDDDGLDDGPEVLTHMSDPLDSDSDDDFYLDKTEVDAGTNPIDPLEAPYPTADFVVDFSPDGTVAGQAGPFHDQDSFPFVAAHEVDSATDPLFGVDRSETWPVAALGGASVTATLSYPDSTDPRIKQMIGRPDDGGAGGSDHYVGDKVDVMRDWVGIDARTGSGGNGTGAPTTMRLNLAGLPDGTYLFRGYHHDVANQKGRFEIVVSDATRSATSLGLFRMTHSSTTYGNHQPENPGAGNPPAALTSTVEFVFTVSGGSSTDIDYLMTETSSGDTVRSSFFALNGFEITATTDTDGDFVPDGADLNEGADDATLNDDTDALDNLREFHLGTDPTQSDTDGDGWNDDVETDTDFFLSLSDTGTSPWVADWDGDGLDDGLETNDLDFSTWPTAAGTDPFLVDTDGDGYSDGDEANGGSDPTDAGSFPTPPPFEARVVAVDVTGGTVTIEWDSLDNGTAVYDIYASETLAGDPVSTWTLAAFGVPAAGTTTSFTETQVGSGSGSQTLPSPMPVKRFYLVYESAQ